jgi:hypothetical protein
MTGMGENVAYDRLRAAVTSGAIVVGFRSGRSITGTMTRTPVYRLAKL